MASCIVIFGLLFLALGFLSSGVSFCAPYWLYNHNNYQDIGLWGHGYCNRKDSVSVNIGASDTGVDFDLSTEGCIWRWAWESDWAWEKDKLNQSEYMIKLFHTNLLHFAPCVKPREHVSSNVTDAL